MSVVGPLPEKVLFVAPLKMTVAPAVLLLVLKSNVPLFVRSPKMVRVDAVCVPVFAV
jgi:hypothetical protein